MQDEWLRDVSQERPIEARDVTRVEAGPQEIMRAELTLPSCAEGYRGGRQTAASWYTAAERHIFIDMPWHTLESARCEVDDEGAEEHLKVQGQRVRGPQ